MDLCNSLGCIETGRVVTVNLNRQPGREVALLIYFHRNSKSWWSQKRWKCNFWVLQSARGKVMLAIFKPESKVWTFPTCLTSLSCYYFIFLLRWKCHLIRCHINLKCFCYKHSSLVASYGLAVTKRCFLDASNMSYVCC